MSAPTPLSADNPLMPRLYQAAIGPLQTAYYQQQFERFDALGRPLPSWNWAAGCCTLGWMGLRGLWKPAIGYAALLAVLMALWWALDLHHRLPMPAAWALALLLALLCVLLPGLGGNALYHRHVRQRTMQALTQSRTLGEAMTLLQAQAPTPARLQWATTGHALAALLTAGLAWAACTSLPAAPAAASTPADANAPHTQQDMARALAALQPAAPSEATEADGTPAEPSAPATVAESENPHAEASASSPTAEASATAAAAPTLVAASAALAAAPTASGNAREEAVATPAPPATPERKPADKTAKAEKTKNAPPAKVEKTEKTSKLAKAGKNDTKTEASQKTALQAGKFYLNSGLYTQPENARRVARQLREAGQPVFTQLVASRKGEATRVRVGPFDSKVQAEAAAQAIQALHLEAQLFRHAAN